MVSSLQLIREEMTTTDTAATPERVAYIKIVYVERALQYLVHLRIGDDPEDLWRLVKPKTRERAAARWGSGGRGRPEHYLDLTGLHRDTRQGLGGVRPGVRSRRQQDEAGGYALVSRDTRAAESDHASCPPERAAHHRIRYQSPRRVGK
jgi:hypothetical protein